MTFSRKLTALLIVAVAIASLPHGVRSQTADRERIRSALDLTDTVIKGAKPVVMESRSQKARLTLENAITLQERARVRAEAGNYSDTRQNDMAYKLSLEAREEAKRAVSFARTETRMLEKHRRVMERTRERLSALRSRMSESSTRDTRTGKLVDDAAALLEKSRTNSAQMNNRLALKLALNAEKLADQAENRFRKTNGLRKMCERRLALMERLTDRVRARVSSNGEAGGAEQLRLAERQMERARNLFAEGRYLACRAEIVNSEKTMRGLLNRMGPAAGNRTQSRIEQAWRLYQRAEESVEETGRGGKLLERARNLINSAEAEAARGNEGQGNEYLNRARTILHDIIDGSRGKMTAERVRNRIQSLEAERNKIRAVVESCKAPESRTLYQRAMNHIEKARDELDAGNIEGAYASARIASNLFERITEICSI